MSKRILTWILGGAAILASSPALAQTGAAVRDDDEIVVTANKRAQALLDIPASVAALNEETLERLQITDVQDYADLIPGLDIAAPVPGVTKTTIRGLSSESVTSTVGVYINETPVTQNELDPDLKLFDVNRIEVLRGPQGTLYGEGSLGGTLRIITNQPDATAAYGGLQGSVSQFENGDGANYGLSGFFNLPLVDDQIAVRGVLSYRDNASWIDNIGPGQADNDEQTLSGRLALRAQVTPNFDLTLTYIGQRIELGGPRNVIDPALGDLTRSTRANESVTDDLDIVSATWNWDLGFATLTSDTSYYQRSQHTIGNNNEIGGVGFFYNEISGAAAGFPGFAQFSSPPGFPRVTVAESLVDFTGDAEQWTQELRLVSNTDDNSRFDWIVGLFYKDREDIKDTYFSGIVTASPLVNFSTLGIARNRTLIQFGFEQVAVFGEGTLHLTDQLDLTVGVRHAREEVTNQENLSGLFRYNFGTNPPTTTPTQFGPVSDTFESTTPRAVLAYRPNEDWTLYTSVAQGFRAGGFTGVTAFDPDTVWNYEVGARGHIFGGRGTLAVAAYQIDWSDVQVFDDIPTPPFFAVLNLGEAQVRGLEIEATARPTERLELSLGLNLIDTEVTSVDPAATAAVGLVEGNQLQKVPEFSGAFAATYTAPIGGGWDFTATGSVVYQGSAYSDFQNLESEKLDSYTTLGGRIGVENERYGLYLFGRNLTDERIELDISGPGSPVIGTTVARPRLIGVEFRTRFN